MHRLIGLCALGALLASATTAFAQGGAARPVTTPANRPPVVQAICDPCRIEAGRTAVLAADAQDADGDALIYRWTTPAGTVSSPTFRQSRWTAPLQPGAVRITVSVSDGKGGTAESTAAIEVVAPPRPEYAFDDVHFDLDGSTLGPEAFKVLDVAVAAMQANPTLRLDIEGHTCDTGTAGHNLALGERRALAVREHFIGHGIDPSRLRAVNYGQDRPKYDNSREETRRLNRRVALVVRRPDPAPRGARQEGEHG